MLTDSYPADLQMLDSTGHSPDAMEFTDPSWRKTSELSTYHILGDFLGNTKDRRHLGGRVQWPNMIGTLIPMLQSAVELQQFPYLEAPHAASTKRHSVLPASSITDSGPKVMTATRNNLYTDLQTVFLCSLPITTTVHIDWCCLAEVTMLRSPFIHFS